MSNKFKEHRYRKIKWNAISFFNYFSLTLLFIVQATEDNNLIFYLVHYFLIFLFSYLVAKNFTFILRGIIEEINRNEHQ